LSDTLADRWKELRTRHPSSTGEPADLHTTVQALMAAQRRRLDAFRALPEPTRVAFAKRFPNLDIQGREALNAIDALSTQIQAERSRNGEIAVLEKQTAEDRAKQEQTQEAKDRVSKALLVLRDLQEHYTLQSGLARFFADNLESIQGIFSRIHVPRELRLSTLEGCLLERTGSLQPVKLNQVSTGQRAALMLSVFITLNLSLQRGPPLMLIDDPIAHIDDLNALSFLDFLGDVAESGERQVFFATANEKLANLFEKKTEFLGAQRTVHDLSLVS